MYVIVLIAQACMLHVIYILTTFPKTNILGRLSKDEHPKHIGLKFRPRLNRHDSLKTPSIFFNIVIIKIRLIYAKNLLA